MALEYSKEIELAHAVLEQLKDANQNTNNLNLMLMKNNFLNLVAKMPQNTGEIES